MTPSNGQSGSNGGTPNTRGIRPDDVLIGFDPLGDLARSNTLRDVASNLATDTDMAVGQALNTAQTAADAAVKISGDQTIEDVKTFASLPVLPNANPTGLNEAARKKYVDDTVAAVQGLTEWDATIVYTHPVFVTGSDGFPYVSVQGSTGVDPTTDSDNSHWKRFGASAQATEASAGIVELADNAETQAGTDGEKAVTPAGLASVTSTETRRGLVELAIQDEADAGTDTEKAMTPALVARVAVPTGMIMAFGGSTAPSGYLACDGAAVSRTTYDTLFGVIGTTYGAGDGSNTFNLPNLKGRFGIGTSTSRPLGRTGGQANVTLTTGQLPSHTHGDGTLRTTSAGSHSHNSGSYTAASAGRHNHPNHRFAGLSGGGTGWAGDAADPPITNLNTGSAGDHTHDITGSSGSAGSHSHGVSGNSGSAGSGQSHNNLPPYLSITYIIKT